METHSKNQSLPLLDYVAELENRSGYERGQKLLSILESAGLKPEIRGSPLLKIRNIVLDFAPARRKRLLFSAHYDAVKDCPGANDDASGVAVLLGLCRALKGSSARVRIVFFDREEAWLRTPFLRLGLLGSLHYVFTTDLRAIAAVYNLEFCGIGDRLVIWPVKESQARLPAAQLLERSAARLNITPIYSQIPWLLFSSDHLSFRVKGIRQAVSLSLVPEAQLPLLNSFVSDLSLWRIMFGRKISLPGVFSVIHSAEDRSTNLDEGSLQLTLNLLSKVIGDFQKVGSDGNESVLDQGGAP